MTKFNRHHELFPRRNFIEPYNLELHNRPELIVPMDIKAHNALHEKVPTMPTLSEDEAKKILELMDWKNNYLHNILQLISCIERVIESKTAELAIASLEAQILFIKHGAYSLNMNSKPPKKILARK